MHKNYPGYGNASIAPTGARAIPIEALEGFCAFLRPSHFFVVREDFRQL
jgi:hypothetical protein